MPGIRSMVTRPEPQEQITDPDVQDLVDLLRVKTSKDDRVKSIQDAFSVGLSNEQVQTALRIANRPGAFESALLSQPASEIVGLSKGLTRGLTGGLTSGGSLFSGAEKGAKPYELPFIGPVSEAVGTGVGLAVSPVVRAGSAAVGGATRLLAGGPITLGLRGIATKAAATGVLTGGFGGALEAMRQAMAGEDMDTEGIAGVAALDAIAGVAFEAGGPVVAKKAQPILKGVKRELGKISDAVRSKIESIRLTPEMATIVKQKINQLGADLGVPQVAKRAIKLLPEYTEPGAREGAKIAEFGAVKIIRSDPEIEKLFETRAKQRAILQKKAARPTGGSSQEPLKQIESPKALFKADIDKATKSSPRSVQHYDLNAPRPVAPLSAETINLPGVSARVDALVNQVHELEIARSRSKRAAEIMARRKTPRAQREAQRMVIEKTRKTPEAIARMGKNAEKHIEAVIANTKKEGTRRIKDEADFNAALIKRILGKK